MGVRELWAAVLPLLLKACTEEPWCTTSPGTKPLPNGAENDGCRAWYRECPCSCATTSAKKADEAKAKAEAAAAEAAETTARNQRIADALEDPAAGRNVRLVVLVRSQQHVSHESDQQLSS